jgi:hypothetical protein
MTFLLYIILYVAEVQPPAIYLIDILSAVWIISYTFRDIGTGTNPFYRIVNIANLYILNTNIINNLATRIREPFHMFYFSNFPMET